MAAKKQESVEIEVPRLREGILTCYVRGSTSIIYNAMSAKVKQTLLYPRKKTAAEKNSTAKHDPISEFRGTMYTAKSGPTLLTFPSVAFKRALASVAIDLGGAKRTQVERLVWALDERIPIWGVPTLRMDITRQADMARTPDVRTRATLAEWACKVRLKYVMPAINETTVVNLLASAGMIRGIGDFRQEKGAGNHGQFELVSADDPDWNRIVAEGGREAQLRAVENPVCYDEESEALLAWWHEENVRRGHHKNGNGSGETDEDEDDDGIEAQVQ